MYKRQDIWCSYKDKTVEEYFIKAYNDPAITDVYQHSIDPVSYTHLTLPTIYSV